MSGVCSGASENGCSCGHRCDAPPCWGSSSSWGFPSFPGTLAEVPVASGGSPSPFAAPTRNSRTPTGSLVALPSEQTQSRFLLSLGTCPAGPRCHPWGQAPGRARCACSPSPTPTPAPPRLRVRARRSWSPSACHAPALPGLPGSGHLPAVPGAAPRAPGQACAPLLPRPCLPPLPAFRSLRRRRLLPRPPQPATPSPLRQQWDLVRLPVFCCDPSPAGAAIAQRLAVKTRTCGEAKALPCRARPPCPAAPQPAGGAGIVQCGRGAPGQLTVVWTGLLRLSQLRQALSSMRGAGAPGRAPRGRSLSVRGVVWCACGWWCPLCSCPLASLCPLNASSWPPSGAHVDCPQGWDSQTLGLQWPVRVWAI